MQSTNAHKHIINVLFNELYD